MFSFMPACWTNSRVMWFEMSWRSFDVIVIFNEECQCGFCINRLAQVIHVLHTPDVYYFSRIRLSDKIEALKQSLKLISSSNSWTSYACDSIWRIIVKRSRMSLAQFVTINVSCKPSLRTGIFSATGAQSAFQIPTERIPPKEGEFIFVYSMVYIIARSNKGLKVKRTPWRNALAVLIPWPRQSYLQLCWETNMTIYI